jgi:hypothetical protein
MNNLVTAPFFVIIDALQSKDTKHVVQPGIHVFHDTSLEAQFPFDHLQDLYTSNVFVTEHDTHSGGDLETRDLAELFEVNNNCLVSVFFVLERKKPVLLVLKYSGTFDAFELLKVYERLLKDENRVL